MIDFSANLTDKQKMITEHWANGPHSELPPGHWDRFIPDAADQRESRAVMAAFILKLATWGEGPWEIRWIQVREKAQYCFNGD